MSDPITLSSRLVAIETRLAALEARLAQLERPLPLTSIPDAYRPASIPTGVPAQPERGWRPVNHRLTRGCGRIAFYLTRAVSPTEPASITLLRVGSDLHAPALGEASTCRSCGAEIDPFTTRDLDWSDAFTTDSTPDPAPDPASDPASDPARDQTLAESTGRLASIQDAMTRARAAGLVS